MGLEKKVCVELTAELLKEYKLLKKEHPEVKLTYFLSAFYTEEAKCKQHERELMGEIYTDDLSFQVRYMMAIHNTREYFKNEYKGGPHLEQ